jgi:AhpD family alkylhydroperoxidase
MSRQEVYKEIEQTLGLVPEQFKVLPEEALGPNWELFKRYQLSDQTLIPPKYKQLIGLAVAGAIRCPYCTVFHSEAAKLMGATSAELEEAVHVAKETQGWSTYLNGLRLDFERFKDEVRRVVEYVKARTLSRTD